MPLLNINKLSVKIENKFILSEIDFVVPKGETLALLGHNGAGKSTLIQTITGIRDKHTGTITLNEYNQEDILNYKENFVYLPEEPLDRKSTRLNSSHIAISYAVFCLKNKIN